MTDALATTAPDVAVSVIQVVLIALGGPLLVGIMAKVRARAERRVGAPVLQPLHDLRKLLAKESLHADTTSPVFALVPLVVVATTVVAAAITPLLTSTPVLAGSADALVVVFLLLTGSVAIALGGLDAGTAFGGMGASRAMTIGALAEPALLVALLALAIDAGTSNLPSIIAATLSAPTWSSSAPRLLALIALLVVVVAETGRIPVDNPATHLELTMVHEAMVLEYAGPELGVLALGEQMRLGYLVALVTVLVAPWGIDVGVSLGGVALATGVLCAKALVVAVGIAVVEVATAKLRLFRVPELLAGGFVLAVLAVVTGLVAR